MRGARLGAFSNLMAALARTALVAAGAGLIAMTGCVAWLVLGRYVLNDTPTWTEPAVLLLMSWFIILGAAVGVRERDHLGFEIGLHVAPPPLRRAMKIVTDLLVGGFGLAMVVYGWQLAAATWAARTPMLGLSQGWDYAPMVAGGALVALFSVEKLIEHLVRAEEPEPPVAPETTGGA